MDAIINTNTAKNIRTWFLPVTLPTLFYPLAQYFNGYCAIDNEVLTIYDLKLAVFSAALVLFGFRALPGFLVFLVMMFWVGPPGEHMDALCLVLAATLSYVAYRKVVGRRSCASFGRIKISLARLVWLCGYNILLYLVFSKLFAQFVGHSHRPDVGNIPTMTLDMLVRIQGSINGCMTGIPFLYTIYRILRRPPTCSPLCVLSPISVKGILAYMGSVYGVLFCFCWFFV